MPPGLALDCGWSSSFSLGSTQAAASGIRISLPIRRRALALWRSRPGRPVHQMDRKGTSRRRHSAPALVPTSSRAASSRVRTSQTTRELRERERPHRSEGQPRGERWEGGARATPLGGLVAWRRRSHCRVPLFPRAASVVTRRGDAATGRTSIGSVGRTNAGGARVACSAGGLIVVLSSLSSSSRRCVRLPQAGPHSLCVGVGVGCPLLVAPTPARRLPSARTATA